MVKKKKVSKNKVTKKKVSKKKIVKPSDIYADIVSSCQAPPKIDE